METYIIISLIFFVSIIAYWITVVIQFWKKRKLDKQKIRFYKKVIKKAWIWTSYKERIIEYDKIYHKILISFWYDWSFWDILKLYPNEIEDIDKIWELHKLRNKLVHEFDLITWSILKKKAQEYHNELIKLIK